MIASERALRREDCRDAIDRHCSVAPADLLRAAAAHAGDADRDVYGVGETLNGFEREIATLLGKEAAVFMPSGTMAQQIALRIVAERQPIRAFAGHPTNHLALHELDGFARLHQLHFVPAGEADRLMTLADLEALTAPVATLLLELPQREIGGQLPSWDDLVAITAYARKRGWHLHLDGARLWECGPFYGRPYSEIVALFDSVYVSFYKGLGALAGAMLAAPASLIDEARLWQRRHGGNLVSQMPNVVIARQAFAQRFDRMAAYVAAAKRVARALERYPAVSLWPNPPPTNMFHAHLRGSVAHYLQRGQTVAREHGIWTISRLTATAIPDVMRWEINCGDATVALSDERLDLALAGLLGPG